MSDDTRYDLRTLRSVHYDLSPNPHRYADPAETQRLVDACREDDERGDADALEFEKARRFEARRRRRKSESGGVALVCFVALALMLLPTVAAKWPVETAFAAAAIGAWVGIRKGASRGAEW